MRYTVLWTPEAEEQLAAIWIESSNRQAIREASQRIDESLRRDPASQGESRVGNERVVHDAPLGVTFEVIEADRTVFVIEVWQYRSRP